MKLWIRVDAAMPRDPDIAALADELNVGLPTLIGHVVTLWGVMAEHTVDGDLSGVNDATLERWAGWTRPRGAFAKAFRARFVGADGILRGWPDRQGALLKRQERDRARWHTRKPAETPPPLRTGSDETPRSLRVDSASTERNGTERRRKKKPPSPDGSGFPVGLCKTLHAQWVRAVGAVHYPRFRKALQPLFPEGPPLYSETQLAAAIVYWGEYMRSEPPDRAGFCTVERFAQDIKRSVELGAMPNIDPEWGIATERGKLTLRGVFS